MAKYPNKAEEAASRRAIDQVLERMKKDRRYANRIRKDPLIELARIGVPISATIELLREEDGGVSQREVEILRGVSGIADCWATCACTGCCATCWHSSGIVDFPGEEVILPG